jgi:hypothetical protein
MRIKALALAAVLALMTSSCSSEDDVPVATAPAPVSATAAPQPVPATISTRTTTDCATKERQRKDPHIGNCWLPLYTELSHKSRVINLRESDDSPCRTPDVNGALPDSQKNCWPQPGEVVNVVCQKLDASGVLWYGVDVPLDKILNPLTKPGQIGWNMAQFLTIENPTSVRTC